MVDPRDLGHVLGEHRDGGGIGTGSGPGYDPTLFLYDRVPGGIGLVPRLYDTRTKLLTAAGNLIYNCRCEKGCPACVGPVVGVEDADVLGNRRRIALEILERLDCF